MKIKNNINDNIRSRKFTPLFLTLILLLILTVVPFRGYADEANSEKVDIQVVDITSEVSADAFTLSWQTNGYYDCTVIYSTKDDELDDDALVEGRDDDDIIFGSIYPTSSSTATTTTEYEYSLTVNNQGDDAQYFDGETAYYKIICYDEDRNRKVSDVYSFDHISVLELSNIEIPSGYITATTARVTWSTNIEASSFVYYRKKGIESWSWQGSDEKTVSHSVSLPNLISSTSYEYYVSSKDEDDNIKKSNIREFTTLTEESSNNDKPVFHLKLNNDFKDAINGIEPLTVGGEGFIDFTNGLLGQGARFGGNTSYAEYSCSGVVNPFSGTVQVAVSFDDFSTSDQAVWHTDDSRLVLYYDYSGSNSNGRRRLKARFGGVSGERSFIIQKPEGKIVWPEHSWHVMAMTWKSASSTDVNGSGVMKYYLDGDLVGERSYLGNAGCSTFRVGNNYWPGMNWDQGVIDEVKIYENALAADVIEKNYHTYPIKKASKGNDDDKSKNQNRISKKKKDTEVEKLEEKARKLKQNQLDDVLTEIKELRDVVKEQQNEIKYLRSLVADLKAVTQKAIDDLNHFITYGIDDNTKKLGAGERAAVVYSYKQAFGDVPENEEELTDVFKIANGRWPTRRSRQAEETAREHFRKIYQRAVNLDNPNDNAALFIMAYGLRQKAENRNMNSERAGIETFRNIFGRIPETTEDWNIMQAITYSGATRTVVDSDGDGLSDAMEEKFGTDKNAVDTDGDGYPDGREVVNGYSPLE